MTNSPLIVLGTGRCGSTLLTRIFHDHSDILSVSEFFATAVDFGGRVDWYFDAPDMTGQAFWSRMSEAMPRVNVLAQHGLEPSEYVYPFRSGQTRFDEKTGMPVLLPQCLAAFDEDPDQLFDALEAAFADQPERSVRGHQDWMFGWLMQRYGNKMWVERSGATLVLFEQVFTQYPDAKFLHIVRDGRNTAVSMQHHSAFRLFLMLSQLNEALGYDPYETDDRTGAENLPLELAAFLPENFNRETFLAATPPIGAVGTLWSDMIVGAFSVLESLPKDKVLTIGYEQLCSNSHEILSQVFDFMGVDASAEWLDKTAKSIRMSSSDWRTLPPEEQAELEAACAPGMALVEKYTKV